jgi:hypothetical protein
MHMRVDEAGQDEMRPVVDAFCARSGLGRHVGIGPGGDDLAIVDQQPTILLIAVGGVVVRIIRPAQEGQRAAAKKYLAHATAALPRTRSPAVPAPAA